MTRDDRPILERLLDVPQRALERAPLPDDARLVATGTIRLLKQMLRSARQAGGR